MSEHDQIDGKFTSETWSPFAKYYDPIQIGSIDGIDTEPHDKAIVRAINSEYRPNRHIKGKPECTIFAARLSHKTTKDTIKDVFSKFGRIKRFRLVKDIVTGTPKGYAFIEYETEREAEEAYRKAHKMFLDGQKMFVDFECERLLKGWKPRRLGGGFGGRKESGQLRFGGRDRPFRKPVYLELQEQEMYERDQRSRDGRSDDRRDYRHRNTRDREERRSYSRERNKEYQYRLERANRSRSRDYDECKRRDSLENHSRARNRDYYHKYSECDVRSRSRDYQDRTSRDSLKHHSRESSKEHYHKYSEHEGRSRSRECERRDFIENHHSRKRHKEYDHENFEHERSKSKS